VSKFLTPWVRKKIVSLSDKIVYASTPYTQMKSQLNEASAELIDFTRTPGTEADRRVLNLARMLRPWTASNLDLIRVGGPGDGGYVMASPLEAQGAMSLGVGRDVSWDRAVGTAGIPVEMFDPTVRRSPAQVPRGRFHRLGVGRARPTYLPVNELLAVSGWTNSWELILKMDVEGAEWEVLEDPHLDLSRFRQILIEFHDIARLQDSRRGQRAITALERLVAYHKPVHVHANNYDEVVRFGAYWFPNTIEVSFLRNDLGAEWSAAVELRTDFDRPNDERVSDIDLSSILQVAPAETRHD
jgi:hypothetical protein